MRVSVILPTIDEATALRLLLPELRRVLPEGSELLVVDDASTDGTPEVAEALGARVVRRRGPPDLSSAVVEGLREAAHDVCVVMDADLSHPVAIVPQLVAAIDHGAPMAIGSRHAPGGSIRGWGWRRHLASSVGTALARPLTAVSDPMSGVFAIRRSAVGIQGLDPIGFKIALELLVRRGLTPVEVPFAFHDRRHGRSKLRWGVQVDYLRHLGRLYRHRWRTHIAQARRPSV